MKTEMVNKNWNQETQNNINGDVDTNSDATSKHQSYYDNDTTTHNSCNGTTVNTNSYDVSSSSNNSNSNKQETDVWHVYESKENFINLHLC